MTMLHKRSMVNTVVMASALVTALTTALNAVISYEQYRQDARPNIIVLGASQNMTVSQMYDINQARINMMDAIAIAQRKIDGKVVNAEITEYSGKPSYKVEMVSSGKPVEVMIDARNGQLLKG